jgi:hypothetical protein
MDREYWKAALWEALAEVEAAHGKVEKDAAARKAMRARTELKLIGASTRPKRRPSDRSGSAGASS